jgi:hypothetical protein
MKKKHSVRREKVYRWHKATDQSLAHGESFDDAPNLELDVDRRQFLHQVKKDVRHLNKLYISFIRINKYPYGC